MEFNLVDTRIHVQCASPDQVQCIIMQRGSSRYPAACREAVCNFLSRDCLLCSCKTECPYHAIFSQTLAADPVALKRHQKPPLPFAFSFPDFLQYSNRMVIRLIVAGYAINALEMLLQGCISMLKSEKCSIEKITSCDYHGAETMLGSEQEPLRFRDSLVLLSSDSIVSTNVAHYSESIMSLRIVTPLRLVSNGRLLHSFSFQPFFRSVMRRVSSIAFYYADYEFDCNYREISRAAEEIRCISGTFRFTSQPGCLVHGITGSGELIGNFEWVLPFLTLGSYFNAGKGASYGSGVTVLTK